MPTVAHRFTAVLGMALVLALNLLAVCPGAHAWLHAAAKTPACAHGHAHEHDPVPGTDGTRGEANADDCIIVQFAGGTTGSPPAPILTSSPLLMRLATLAVTSGLGAAAPAHLLPPGCGPPAV